MSESSARSLSQRFDPWMNGGGVSRDEIQALEARAALAEKLAQALELVMRLHWCECAEACAALAEWKAVQG